MAGTQTRTRLIEAGMGLFLQDGYAGTGIQAIVRRAGVPKGSFYHFFPGGKEQFATEVVDHYAALAAETRRELLGDTSLVPLARLRRFFEHYAAHFAAIGFQEGCLLGSLSAEVGETSEPIRAHLDQAFGAWEASVAEVLAEAIESGDVASGHDPLRLARHLIQGWEGALLRMKTERRPDALEAFIGLTFDVFLT